MKATAIAPANIAFIKYWGQKDKESFIPYNTSISMNLSNCLTTTTVEFSDVFDRDTVEIGGKIVVADGGKNSLLFEQIERVQHLAGLEMKVRVVSENNFPAGCGIASSASGFAALTLALVEAAGLEMDLRELSRLVRMGGSVSAVRSVVDGFGEAVVHDDDCYAQEIENNRHWDLVDLVAVVASEEKKISSTDGHLRAESSPYFSKRIEDLPMRIEKCRAAILERDLKKLGEVMEEDCLDMHTVMQTSDPAINYFTNGTKKLIETVREMRECGLECYFTIDAGPNVHVICRAEDADDVERRLDVDRVIRNTPGERAKIVDKHLF